MENTNCEIDCFALFKPLFSSLCRHESPKSWLICSPLTFLTITSAPTTLTIQSSTTNFHCKLNKNFLNSANHNPTFHSLNWTQRVSITFLKRQRATYCSWCKRENLKCWLSHHTKTIAFHQNHNFPLVCWYNAAGEVY